MHPRVKSHFRQKRCVLYVGNCGTFLLQQEEDARRREERERVQRERRYTLPENPAILVHPNPQAKNGKFDCGVMSLSVLLDYRPEDNKEHSFEVSALLSAL